MRPDKVTLSQLFGQPRRYVIPLFQRGYVWTRDLNWRPLWLDIVAQVERLIAVGTGSTKGLRRHFLGAVVLTAGEPRVRHVTDHGVIDGQQRLTTLQLFLIAFRDAVIPLADADLTRELTKMTVNEGQWGHPDESFKVWPTVAGREHFRQIVTAGGMKQVQNLYPDIRRRKKLQPKPPLAEAYLYFARELAKYLHGAELPREDDTADETPTARAVDGPIDKERAWLLFEALNQYLQLVAIELEAEDDPQVIFETLNARMVPLTPADLIRNFVFLQGMRREQDMDVLWSDGWEHFETAPTSATNPQPFWPGVTRQGRRYYPRMDLLCFHYVTMRGGSEVSPKHLFQAFRDWWEAGDVGADGQAKPSPSGRDPAYEIRRLRRAGEDLRDYLEPSTLTESRRKTFAERLQVLDLTTPLPVLLYLDEYRDRLSSAEYDGILTDLESYLVRRAACGLTQKNYNRTFLDVLGKLREAGAPRRTTLQAALLGYAGDSGIWPQDGPFTAALLTEPIYRTMQPARTQMVLQALEQAQQTALQEAVTVPWVTIEHVLPQTANVELYPYSRFRETADTANAPEARSPGRPDLDPMLLRDRLVHSLGNLTLVTQNLNSSLSNGPFAAKRIAIGNESLLRLNNYFRNFTGASWGEAEIIQRARTLVPHAIKTWPRPDA